MRRSVVGTYVLLGLCLAPICLWKAMPVKEVYLAAVMPAVEVTTSTSPAAGSTPAGGQL